MCFVFLGTKASIGRTDALDSGIIGGSMDTDIGFYGDTDLDTHTAAGAG